MTYSATIHGVTLAIESDNQAFIDFARSYFNGFETAFSKAVFDCEVKVSWESGYNLKLFPSSKELGHVLGTGLSWDTKTHTLYITDREWNMSVDPKTLSGSVSFKKNLWRHGANRLAVKSSELQKRYYRAAVRILPQQLVAHSLSQKGIRMHSGAAVMLNGKTYAFMGLPGSGKSMLVNHLKKNCGAEILTENFVFTDGKMLYPFPEGNEVSSIAPRKIDSAYLLTHGETFTIESISNDMARSQISTIDAMTAELPIHSKIASLALVDPDWKNESSSNDFSFPCYSLIADNGLSKTQAYFESL